MQQHILQMGVLNDHVRHLPTLKDSPKAVWRGWSSRNSAGVCPDVVAEPVQPQPLNSSLGNLYVATRPWSHQVSHGWEAQREAQGKR